MNVLIITQLLNNTYSTKVYGPFKDQKSVQEWLKDRDEYSFAKGYNLDIFKLVDPETQENEE